MAKLTYIASGMNWTRMGAKEYIEDPILNAWTKDTFLKMQSNPNHNFGVLFNAWTEQGLGKTLQNFREYMNCLYADSGGLQIVTRGLSITEELKKQIYNVQAKHSTNSMSFDEIPLTINNKSIRGDLSNRWFDKSKFEDCARASGKNLYNQIKVFDELGSKAKPVFIIQGNCYDTYMKWYEYALSEVPKELHSRIGGIAMGAASLGEGLLENIQRGFFYSQLPLDNINNHMHLLAVGSMSKILPSLVFIQNKLYDDDILLTYDSTTHTSGLDFGRYYINQKTLNFPRKLNDREWKILYNDINKHFPFEEISLERFHESLNLKSEYYKDTYGSRRLALQLIMSGIFSSIKNFMEHVNLCLSSKDELLSFADSSNSASTFYSLYSVKDKTDFNHWMNHIGKYVNSKPVQKSKSASLGGFFNE